METTVRVEAPICCLFTNRGMIGWAVGHSYADHPVLQPLIYNPNAPAGSRFSSAGLSPATIPRLYHSSALLLLDGENISSFMGRPD
jgi:hypothetical protein